VPRDESHDQDDDHGQERHGECQASPLPEPHEPVPEFGREEVGLSAVQLEIVQVHLVLHRVVAGSVLRLGSGDDPDHDRRDEARGEDRATPPALADRVAHRRSDYRGSRRRLDGPAARF